MIELPYRPLPTTEALELSLRIVKRAFFSVFAISLVVNLLVMALPIYTLQVFDRVLSSQNVNTLLALTVITLFLLAVQSSLDFVRSAILRRAGMFFERQLSGSVLMMALDEAARGNPHASTGLSDVKEVRGNLANPGITAIFDAPWTPVFLLVIFLIHPVLGGFVAATLVTLGAMTFLNLKAAARPQSEEAALVMDVGTQAADYLRNADAIKSMGMMAPVAALWSLQAKLVLSLNDRVMRAVGAVMAATKFIRLGVQMGIMGLGAYLVLQGEITAGAMIASSILMARVLAPVEGAVGGWKGWGSGWQAYGRLKAIGQDDTVTVPPQTALLTPTGHLEVESMFYRTDDQTPPLLKRIDFRLEAGNAVGIIGPSGAGKSTLLRVIAGILAPSAGTVRIDGADLFQWDPSVLGRYIGYMPQDVQLLEGTIAENISRFIPDAQSEDIIAAAQKADVHDAILRLPQGYDTRIGLGGVRLSGGQQQRIALARALYGDPVLILLDEPNAHLDPTGEAALAQALTDARARGASIVVISQRSSLLQVVDWVVIMRDGMVEKAGERTEILTALQGPSRSASGQLTASEEASS